MNNDERSALENATTKHLTSNEARALLDEAGRTASTARIGASWPQIAVLLGMGAAGRAGVPRLGRWPDQLPPRNRPGERDAETHSEPLARGAGWWGSPGHPAGGAPAPTSGPGRRPLYPPTRRPRRPLNKLLSAHPRALDPGGATYPPRVAPLQKTSFHSGKKLKPALAGIGRIRVGQTHRSCSPLRNADGATEPRKGLTAPLAARLGVPAAPGGVRAMAIRARHGCDSSAGSGRGARRRLYGGYAMDP